MAMDPDIDHCVAELRTALAGHGITLPSLGVEAQAIAYPVRPGLVALGNCNARTAQALAEALRTTKAKAKAEAEDR